MQLKRQFFFLFGVSFCCACSTLVAQPQWDGLLLTGRIVKHTDRILPDITENSFALQINYVQRFNGSRHWHLWHEFPEFGLSFNAHSFGDRDIFGRAAGIYPFLGKQYRLSSVVRAQIRMGMGIGYVSRKFDRLQNPENNVISTHWNNLTGAEIGLIFRLSDYWKMRISGQGHHYSNGGTVLPNLGINFAALSVGVSWRPDGAPPALTPTDDPLKYTPPMWGYQISAGAAMRQGGNTISGPLFKVFTVKAGGYRRLSSTFIFHAGMGMEHNEWVRFFIDYSRQMDREGNPVRYRTRLQAYTTGEVFFGNFSFAGEAGFYLRGAEYAPEVLYFTLHCRYHFAQINAIRARFFTGVSLKTHFATAEYFSLHAGISFW